MGPVKDSGIENFFKNFWQPWHAPKGERTAPIIGFIAATILFLPLFLPAVGIAALAKWAVKHVKDSSSHVQNMASKVSVAASRSSSDSVRGSSEVSREDAAELPKLTSRDERESHLDVVRAKKEEFQAFLDRLYVTEEYEEMTKRLIGHVRGQYIWFEENLTELERHIEDSEEFNDLMRRAKGHINVIQANIKKIEQDLSNPKYKGLISLKDLSS